MTVADVEYFGEIRIGFFEGEKITLELGVGVVRSISGSLR